MAHDGLNNLKADAAANPGQRVKDNFTSSDYVSCVFLVDCSPQFNFTHNGVRIEEERVRELLSCFGSDQPLVIEPSLWFEDVENG